MFWQWYRHWWFSLPGKIFDRRWLASLYAEFLLALTIVSGTTGAGISLALGVHPLFATLIPGGVLLGHILYLHSYWREFIRKGN
mgnify:CR=1 FL=1